MNIKITCLLITLCTTIFSGKAQTLTYGIGVQGNYTNMIYNKALFDTLPSFNYAYGVGVTGRLSVGVNVGDKHTLTLSTYPYIGVTTFTYGPTSDSFIMSTEFPLLGEIHFGHANLKDESFFIGGGITTVNINRAVPLKENIGNSFTGVQLSLGGQFYTMGNLLQMRLAFTSATQNKDDVSMVSLVKNYRVTLGITYTFNARGRMK